MIDVHTVSGTAASMDIEDQLLRIGKAIVSVPNDGNSAFESISGQLNDPTMTHNYLRRLTYVSGLRASNLFEKYVGYRSEVFVTELRRIKENNKWNPAAMNLVFHILTTVLERDIILLRNQTAPHFFPSDAEVDEEAIVIVQVDSNASHFHGTKMSKIKLLLQEGIKLYVTLYVVFSCNRNVCINYFFQLFTQFSQY